MRLETPRIASGRDFFTSRFVDTRPRHVPSFSLVSYARGVARKEVLPLEPASHLGATNRDDLAGNLGSIRAAEETRKLPGHVPPNQPVRRDQKTLESSRGIT